MQQPKPLQLLRVLWPCKLNPSLSLPHTLQCGILLGGLLLFVSATLTIWSCKMVLKAANIKSKHSFESLGECVSYDLFHVFLLQLSSF